MEGETEKPPTLLKTKVGFALLGILVTLAFLYLTVLRPRIQQQRAGLVLPPEEVKAACGQPQAENLNTLTYAVGDERIDLRFVNINNKIVLNRVDWSGTSGAGTISPVSQVSVVRSVNSGVLPFCLAVAAARDHLVGLITARFDSSFDSSIVPPPSPSLQPHSEPIGTPALTVNSLGYSSAASSETNQETSAWGATVNGLRMSLSLDSSTVLPSGVPAITLHFRNVGNELFHIVPEFHCAAGPVGTSEVFLSITNSSGDTKRQQYFGPGPPYEGGCGGGLFILDVPLGPGAEYSMPFNVDYYKVRAPTTDRIEDGWEPGGTYTLQAGLTGSSVPRAGGDFWLGTVTSNRLAVHFPSALPQ